MFELNLASLPNRIFYLDGVQLSYIKVYVHIFNLWHSDKPCFISNPQFCERTGLNKDTVSNAITFFERHGELKRVTKGKKRYLVQPTKFIETESPPVDNSIQNSSNDAHAPELDRSSAGVRPLHPPELDRHNNKYNNKYNKSSCRSDEQTKANEKKHDWADQKQKVPLADVTKQSNSHNPSKLYQRGEPSDLLKAFTNKKESHTNETNKLLTRATVQTKMAEPEYACPQSSPAPTIRQKNIAPPIRSLNRVMEACSARFYLEKVGLANHQGHASHAGS